jgi:hypothetical protein
MLNDEERPLGRIQGIKEAKEVIIELDDSYLTSTPKKRYAIQEHSLEPNYQNILKTIARKIKYYFLLWHPVEVEDVGLIQSRLLADIISTYPCQIKLTVVHTLPEGEVQITENTKVFLKFKEVKKSL